MNPLRQQHHTDKNSAHLASWHQLAFETVMFIVISLWLGFSVDAHASNTYDRKNHDGHGSQPITVGDAADEEKISLDELNDVSGRETVSNHNGKIITASDEDHAVEMKDMDSVSDTHRKTFRSYNQVRDITNADTVNIDF